jgi:sirohydrochlorin ferrochelatase
VAGAAARHANALRRQGLFSAVEASALYGEPRLESVVGRLPDGPLDVLPFMMAEGYTLDRLADRLAACRPDARLLRAIGVHAAMADALIARATKGRARRRCCWSATAPRGTRPRPRRHGSMRP